MNDEVSKPDLAAHFRAMADLIDLNKDAKFGGAVVIVPPTAGGNVVAQLLLDSAEDPVQFWTTLQFRIKAVLDDISNSQRLASGGRR